MPESDAAKVQTLQFMLDKRLAQFNLRRDHEWKIFFAVIAVLGAADFVLVSEDIRLGRAEFVLWTLTLHLMFLAAFAYELGVQERNRIDRIVMDDLNEELCREVGLTGGRFRIATDSEKHAEAGDPRPILSHTYLWAFGWQIIVLLVACALSWVVPLVITPGSVPAPGAVTWQMLGSPSMIAVLAGISLATALLLALHLRQARRRSETRVHRTPSYDQAIQRP